MFLFVVLHSGKKITLVVQAADTVESVKQQIQGSEGIPVSKQRLVYITEELRNERTLEDCGFITEGIMFLCMTLFVVITTGKTITLRVSGDDTVESVKLKIQEREGIPVGEQRLKYTTKELNENEKRLVADCDFKNEGTMYLTMRLSGGINGC